MAKLTKISELADVPVDDESKGWQGRHLAGPPFVAWAMALPGEGAPLGLFPGPHACGAQCILHLNQIGLQGNLLPEPE